MTRSMNVSNVEIRHLHVYSTVIVQQYIGVVGVMSIAMDSVVAELQMKTNALIMHVKCSTSKKTVQQTWPTNAKTLVLHRLLLVPVLQAHVPMMQTAQMV